MWQYKAPPKSFERNFSRGKVVKVETEEHENVLSFEVNGKTLKKAYPNKDIDPDSPEADELRAIMGNGELPEEADDLMDKGVIVYITAKRVAGGRYTHAAGLIISEDKIREAVTLLDEVEEKTKPQTTPKTTVKK